ncbi:MAG: lamin tail domain-containing protein, partial [Rhizobiaceae bacterium]
QITNNGPGDLDMTGWTFRKNGKESTTHIPDGTVLQPGESFRIYTGSGVDTAFKMYLGSSEPLWANDHDVIYLRDNYLNIRGYQAWTDSIFTGPESSIVIDDIQYNGLGVDDAANPNGEWIIIRNAGSETVDLSDWRIKDDGGDYVFAEGETLDPGETLKIFIGSGTDSEGVRYWGRTTGILNNDAGTLEIWTPRSQSVDVFTWGAAQSLDENPRGAIRMFANFDAAGNDATNPNGEWVALQNTSDSAIELGGYSVKYGSYVYTFADGVTLAAGANIRVMVGSGADTATTFYWGNPAGILSNTSGQVDLINADDEVLLRHEWPNPSSDVTDYGLVISGVNFDAPGSDADNPNGEWITIRNASSAEQNLLNWQIIVGSNQFVILKDTIMQPGDVVTIYMGSGTDTANTIYWGNAGGILSNTGSTAVELLSPNRDVIETHSWGAAGSNAQSVAAAIDLTVNYDAPGIDENNPNGEWVTLTNVSSQTISLAGYHLYTDGTTYA